MGPISISQTQHTGLRIVRSSWCASDRNVHASAETLRTLPQERSLRPFSGKPGSDVGQGEKGRLRKYWPFCALCCHCAVNRSAQRRALNLFGSLNMFRSQGVLVNSYVFEMLCPLMQRERNGHVDCGRGLSWARKRLEKRPSATRFEDPSSESSYRQWSQASITSVWHRNSSLSLACL